MTATSYTPRYAETAPPHVEVVPRGGRRVSWGAVFAGVMIVLAIQLLLSMLGLGIGLNTVNPTEGSTPNASSLGIGAGVWWGISYLLALFAGGYVAARLAPSRLSFDGALHGVLTWAFALLVTFYLLTTAVGSVIGGAFSAVNGTLSAAGQTAKDVVPQVAQAAGATPDMIQQKAKDLLSAQSMSTDPKSLNSEQAQQEIAANLPKLAMGGDQAKQAHERIVAIMAVQLNITPDEANQRLDKLQGQLAQTTDQAKDKAKQVADKTASGLSKVSLIAFVSLLLGAVAAAVGGSLGVRRHDELAPT
jgi:hypothetical protein